MRLVFPDRAPKRRQITEALAEKLGPNSAEDVQLITLRLY